MNKKFYRYTCTDIILLNYTMGMEEAKKQQVMNFLDLELFANIIVDFMLFQGLICVSFVNLFQNKYTLLTSMHFL